MLRLADFYATLPLTLDAIIDLPARIAPDRVALETDEEAVTFAELVRRRDLLANEIIDSGMRRFERCGVAVCGARAILWTLALARAGCVAVPLAAQLESEAETLATTIGLRAIVGRDGQLRRLERREDEAAFDHDDDVALQNETKRAGAYPIDVDPALAIGTSGTEGQRRFVVLQHHAIIANIISNVRALGLRDDDRTLVVLPVTHAYALIAQVLSHLCVGATVRFWNEPVVPALLTRAIDRHKITTVFAVPALARLLGASPRPSNISSSLRLIAIGAANAPASVVDALRERYRSARIALTYGLTQAGPRVATRFLDGLTGDTTNLGAPNPNVEITIGVRDGVETIAVRSRSSMRSYADEVFAEGGDAMIETGDVGTLRDGHVLVTGRRSRAINRAGRLIAVERIERVLAGDPRVQAVRVASEPHAFYGEVAIANAYVDGDALADESLEAALHLRCARALEHAECPQRIVIRAADPSMYDVKERAVLEALGALGSIESPESPEALDALDALGIRR